MSFAVENCEDDSFEEKPQFFDFTTNQPPDKAGEGSSNEDNKWSVNIKDEPLDPDLEDNNGIGNNLIKQEPIDTEEEQEANVGPDAFELYVETQDRVTLENNYEEANIDNLPVIDQYAVVEYLTSNPEKVKLPRDHQFGKERTDDAVGFVRLKREGVRVIVRGIVSSGVNINYHVQVHIDENTVTILSSRCNSCFIMRGSTGCCVHIFRFLTWLLNRSEDENGRHEYNFFRPSVLSILKGKTLITLQELTNEQYVMPLESPESFRKELCEEFMKRNIRNRLTILEGYFSHDEEEDIGEYRGFSDDSDNYITDDDEITMRRGEWKRPRTYCKYCGNFVSRFNRHVLTHKHIPEVRDILAAHKDKSEIAKSVNIMKHRSHFEANSKRLLVKEEKMPAKKRKRPCPVCLKMICGSNLTRHLKKIHNQENFQAVKEAKKIVLSRSGLAYDSPCIQELLAGMMEDDLLPIIKADKDLLQFAEAQLEYLHTRHSENNVRRKLREAAQIVQIAREGNGEISDIKSLLKPIHSSLFIKCIKEVGEYKDGKFRKPRVALFSGYTVKKIATFIRRNESDEGIISALDSWMENYQARFNSNLAKMARKQMENNKLDKQDTLPLDEDTYLQEQDDAIQPDLATGGEASREDHRGNRHLTSSSKKETYKQKQTRTKATPQCTSKKRMIQPIKSDSSVDDVKILKESGSEDEYHTFFE